VSKIQSERELELTFEERHAVHWVLGEKQTSQDSNNNSEKPKDVRNPMMRVPRRSDEPEEATNPKKRQTRRSKQPKDVSNLKMRGTRRCEKPEDARNPNL